MNETISRYAASLGQGLIAGLAGTMTISSAIEMKVRGPTFNPRTCTSCGNLMRRFASNTSVSLIQHPVSRRLFKRLADAVAPETIPPES